jgi:hypothetical protein
MTVSIVPVVNDEQWHALRKVVVGASEAAALLGEHEYLTYYALWARKAGKLPPEVGNAAMERGRRLEPVAVDVIRDRFPDMEVRNPRAHYSDPDCGLGATPDLIGSDDRGEGIIQIKSVAPSIFRQIWLGETDAPRPPNWIVIQALLEAHLTGGKWAKVAALVVDHEIDLHLIEVPLHAGIIDALKKEAIVFWELVTSGREPDPDFKRDAELVRAVLKQDDGSEIDLSDKNELPGLIASLEAAQTLAKQYEGEIKAINAQLLHELGHATLARFKGGYISAKTINRASYEVKATSYRQLRVVKKDVPREKTS